MRSQKKTLKMILSRMSAEQTKSTIIVKNMQIHFKWNRQGSVLKGYFPICWAGSRDSDFRYHVIGFGSRFLSDVCTPIQNYTVLILNKLARYHDKILSTRSRWLPWEKWNRTTNRATNKTWQEQTKTNKSMRHQSH